MTDITLSVAINWRRKLRERAGVFAWSKGSSEGVYFSKYYNCKGGGFLEGGDKYEPARVCNWCGRKNESLNISTVGC